MLVTLKEAVTNKIGNVSQSVIQSVIIRNGGAVSRFQTQFFGFIEIFEQIELVYCVPKFN